MRVHLLKRLDTVFVQVSLDAGHSISARSGTAGEKWMLSPPAMWKNGVQGRKKRNEKERDSSARVAPRPDFHIYAARTVISSSTEIGPL